MKAISLSKSSPAELNAADWEWFGHAAHICGGSWCRFHMATKVGPWLVSTVGLYVHPRNPGSSEKSEAAWLRDNPNGEEIGYNRTYETMVFKAGPCCTAPGCGCGLPQIDGPELDSRGYNNAGDARKGHMELCVIWARKSAATGATVEE